ncbi:MAG: cysteine--tRNA ligase, partial [Stellaceae bacterium]
VENITDINDKIYVAATKLGVPSDQLAREMTRHYIVDTDRFGLDRPDVEPRATDSIPEIVALIGELVDSGHAYEAGGDVYFAVRSHPAYGELSGQRPDDLEAGARVEPGEHKRDPVDFALWKATKPDEDTWWDSPWGRGRPGWHIECSAMAEKFLGREFAMHGGGRDLIFPHHENEVAQSECAHAGERFANFWVHNGFLSVDSTKMSKSLGNFVTAHEVLKKWPGEVVRLALLSTHYRDPLDWTEERLRQESQRLMRFYIALNRGKGGLLGAPDHAPCEVGAALNDDLNAPLALVRLHELVPQINLADDQGRFDERDRLQSALAAGGRLLGILERDPETYLRGAQAGDEVLIRDRIQARTEARQARNFAEADRLRSELANIGIILEDKPDGTTKWRRA